VANLDMLGWTQHPCHHTQSGGRGLVMGKARGPVPIWGHPTICSKSYAKRRRTPGVSAHHPKFATYSTSLNGAVDHCGLVQRQ
jgi:hypothetical protein